MKHLERCIAITFWAVALSMTASPLEAVVYLDEAGPLTNGGGYTLSNTPTADVWYISADYTVGDYTESTWAGMSLYDAGDGENQFFGRGGGSSLSVGTVRGGGPDADWIDLTDNSAEPATFHLTMEVDSINQTVKLWLNGTSIDADAPDYAGPLPNAEAGNYDPVARLSFWARDENSSVANILISDSLKGHLPMYPITNLEPGADAVDVSTSVMLTWEGPMDPNISVVDYAVYLDPNELYVTNLDTAQMDYYQAGIIPGSPVTTFVPAPALDYDTLYSWRVVATVQYDYNAPGDVNEIASEVWSFRTKMLDSSPVVDAGPKFITTTALAASPFFVKGSVIDDEVTPVTVNWQAFDVALGGGLTTKVSFSDAGDPNTTITISESGTYALKLTAMDGANPAVSDQKEIVVLDDGCQAIKSTGTWEAGYYDRNNDCVVDMADFAVFASDWLSSTALSQIHESSVPIPDPEIAEALIAEYWLNVDGTDVNDLLNDPRYPLSPDGAFFITDELRAPSNSADNFGRRIYGYLVPPATGDYRFYIASDDQSRLFLSADTTPVDTDPALKSHIAEVPDPAGDETGWTNADQWDKYPEQASGTVSLTAGQYYYIEALQKEDGQGDHLSVGWILPGETEITVIPGTALRFSAP